MITHYLSSNAAIQDCVYMSLRGFSWTMGLVNFECVVPLSRELLFLSMRFHNTTTWVAEPPLCEGCQPCATPGAPLESFDQDTTHAADHVGGDAVYIIRKRWPYTAKPLRIQYSTRGLTSLERNSDAMCHLPPLGGGKLQAEEGLATA